MPNFRIGTWNLGSVESAHSVFSALRRLDIDVCAFQEINISANRIWSWESRAEDYQLIFHPTLSPDYILKRAPAHYGLAFASRLPVRSVYSFQLNQLERSNYDAETEPRLLQILTLPEPVNLIIGNTHLAHTTDWSPSGNRAQQAANIGRIVAQIPQVSRLILCGDFNVSSDSTDLDALRKIVPNVYSPEKATYIGKKRRRVIDYFFSNQPLNCSVSTHLISSRFDHKLVVLELRMGGEV